MTLGDLIGWETFTLSFRTTCCLQSWQRSALCGNSPLQYGKSFWRPWVNHSANFSSLVSIHDLHHITHVLQHQSHNNTQTASFHSNLTSIQRFVPKHLTAPTYSTVFRGSFLSDSTTWDDRDHIRGRDWHVTEDGASLKGLWWQAQNVLYTGWEMVRKCQTEALGGKKADQYFCLSESLSLFNEISLPYLPVPRSG